MLSKKILILMRHARPASGAVYDDFTIPISKEGAEAEKRLCQKLEEEGYLLKEVLTSPYQRAKETAQIVADHFGQESLIVDELGEPFDKNLLLKKLQDSATDTIAFVGHGPTLTELANQCLGKVVFKDILSKSSAVIIEFQGKVKTGAGKLLAYLK